MQRKLFLSALFALLTGGCGGAASAQNTAATAWQQNFETPADAAFAPVGGRNMTGSTFSVAREKNRRGEYSRAARLDYNFSSDGWVELHFADPPVVPASVLQENGEVVFSAWLRGVGKPDFSRASLRFVDARGETFQYPAREMIAALNGNDWQRVRVAFNLNQVVESWGEGADKKLDAPLRFLGFAFNHNSSEAQSGTILMDDISLRAAPSGALPQLRFESRRPLFIWKPGEPVAFDARISYGAAFVEGFEPPAGREYSQGEFDYAMLGGRNAEGSRIAPANAADDQAAVHGGRGALRLDYRLNGGHVEINARHPQLVENGARGVFEFALWVRGADKNDFSRVFARFTDARGETMQFPLSEETVAAFNGSGWREAKSRVDFSRIEQSWGEGADKIADLPLRFSGFALEQNGDAATSGTIFLDDVRVTSTENRPPLRVALRWQARDFDGKTVAQGSAPLSLAWGATASAPVVFSPRATGFFSLGGEVVPLDGAASTRTDEESDAVLAQAETRAAVFASREKPIAAAPYLIGVASHPTRVNYEEQKLEVELMRRLGFAACRFDFVWGEIEPEEGKFNWEATDRLLALMLKNGIEPLPVVGYSTIWGSTGDTSGADWTAWHNAPPRIEAFTAFLKAAATRYKNRIRYWEVWNEPDIAFWKGTQQQYSALLGASVHALREADPSAKVMNGGFTGLLSTMPFKAAALRDANPRPDIIAIHSHGSFLDMVREMNANLPSLRAVMTDAPVWLNEAGWTTAFITERDQAMTLVKKIAFAPALGLSNYVWYDLRNDGWNAAEGEHNFGLVRRDFSPKAALVAAHTTLDRLDGKRFVKRLAIGEDLYAVLYSDARESVIVTWNEAVQGGETPRFFRTDASRAATQTMMGASTRVPLRNGLMMLNFGAEPQLVTLSHRAAGAALQLENAPSVLQTAGALHVAPGASTRLEVRVENPFAAPLRGTLTLKASEGYRVAAASNAGAGATLIAPAKGPLSLPISLAPRASTTLNFAVEEQRQSGAAPRVDVLLAAPSLAAPVSAQVRLKPSAVAPKLASLADFEAMSARQPPLVSLQDGANLISLFFATPMQELHFKGAADLSARVYLASIPEGIALRVLARDDRHVQAEKSGEEWKGDALQFALATSDGRHYEWLLALTESGPRLTTTIAPPDVQNAATPSFSVRREGDTTIYQAVIPRALPGVEATMQSGAAFNVLLNDNDGGGRKGWLEWSPGIGVEKNPALFNGVVFR